MSESITPAPGLRLSILGDAEPAPALDTRELLEVMRRVRPMQDALELVHEDVALDEFDKSRKLPDRAFPYSCTDEEGLALYHVVASNGLRSGYEVATAFGYSTGFLGLAAQRSGGEVVTMDCFVEEWKESFSYEADELGHAMAQTIADVHEGRYPRGLEMANANLAALGLQDVVVLTLGVSPDHVDRALSGRVLDFAFIDGGHFDGQPRRDFAAVAPYLAQRCAVFFHDNNDNPAVEEAVALAEDLLDAPAAVLPTRYGLTLVARDLDPGTVPAMMPLFARHRAGV